jgi:hypothetical protein
MPTYSLAKLSLALATICIVFVTMPVAALAQSVSGAVGVSATILPPDRSQAPRLLSVSLARNGFAHLETTPPAAGAASQIVMVTVSSPTNSFAPLVQAPTLVRARAGTDAARAAVVDTIRTRRLGYEVPFDRPPADTSAHTVSVRITYLIVPGT